MGIKFEDLEIGTKLVRISDGSIDVVERLEAEDLSFKTKDCGYNWYWCDNDYEYEYHVDKIFTLYDRYDFTISVPREAIPEWATHLTLDAAGIYAFAEEPKLDERSYYAKGRGIPECILCFDGYTPKLNVKPQLIRLPSEPKQETADSMSAKFKAGDIGFEEFSAWIKAKA